LFEKARVLLVASAMQFTSLIQMTLIATTLIGANAYLRRSPATAEDLRIGRQAMPISEVKLMLHGGSSQDSITDEVKRRHIPEKISAATEIELTESGAKPAVIAALKDENNILTRNQKDAFDKRMELADATRQTRRAKNVSDKQAFHRRTCVTSSGGSKNKLRKTERWFSPTVGWKTTTSAASTE
jgi:hypothetical protein